MPHFAGPFLYSSAARLSALLYSTQLLLLLGSGLRLDSLFRPALSYPRYSVRATGSLQTLLLLSSFFQLGPLEFR
jgi:hypothetical protein